MTEVKKYRKVRIKKGPKGWGGLSLLNRNREGISFIQ